MYNEKQQLVPQFHPGLEIEPLYRPANFDDPNSYDKEHTIYGLVLNSSIDSEKECEHMISPVASEESDSSTSSIASVGEIIVPGSKLNKYKL